eukprot:1153782-Pelagomonas_calceolata.AAC.6
MDIRTGIIRGILADYGVPLLVVAWTALSYALQSGGKPVPSGIPRRVSSPLTWQVKDSWATVTRMGDVPGPYIAVALIPGQSNGQVNLPIKKVNDEKLGKPTHARPGCVHQGKVLTTCELERPSPPGPLAI